MAKLAEFAIEIYNRAGLISKGSFEKLANAVYTVAKGMANDWSSTGINGLDIPGAGRRIEIGLVHHGSRTSQVSPSVRRRFRPLRERCE